MMGVGLHIFCRGHRAWAPIQRDNFLAQVCLETKL